ncbi:MAG: MFS transporter [Thermomicrobiales bacterium]
MTAAEPTPETWNQREESELRQWVLKDPGVRALIVSRLAASLGITALSYGTMVYLATVGASQFTISLVGGTQYLAALLFGIGGGALAEATSKRRAMVVPYLLQAVACFVVPAVWGASVSSLIVLVFVVAMLGQVATPALKAATALVSTPAMVAVVAAMISIASGIGAAIGSAFLAPMLIKVASLETLLYVTGGVLALGAVRAIGLPGEMGTIPLRRAMREIAWRTTVPSLKRTAAWLWENRTVAAMILIGSIVLALFDGLNTLMPVYVRDVLGADPTNTVYILAPGGLGFLAGTLLGPWLMDRHGERALGVMALTILSLGYVLFGLIDLIWPVLAPVSPLRLLTLAGIDLSPRMQAVGLISILTALGSTGAGAAVQTYINRYVILARQPSTFGMQEVLDNSIALIAILSLGALSTAIGPKLVFVLAPPLIIGAVIALIRVCFRVTDRDPPAARAILKALLDPSREGDPRLAGRPAGGDGP